MTTTGAMPNSFDFGRVSDLDPRARALVTRRRDLLGPGYKLFYDRPLEIVRGEGVHLFDETGAAYLDAYNNVPSVGHCHPHVVDAVSRQVRTLNTNTRYLGEPLLDYAERLLATHHGGLTNIMFACTGSEATDLALRIARYATGGPGIVVSSNAYHGVTAAAAEVSPSLGPREPLGAFVRAVSPPTASEGADGAGAAFGVRVAEAFADLRRHGFRPAAVLMDTIFSSDGVVVDPAGFLQAAVAAAHSADALFIADEVQPGFGRTGAAMWGYERHGTLPDLVTMGKPMGNGMPISAVAARPELLERFGNDIRYFNTFGANSVSVAAAAAVLDVIEREDLIRNSGDVGAYMRGRIEELSQSSPAISDVRGVGLFIAMDVVDPATGAPDPQLARRVINEMRDRHVLISGTGAAASALKIRPPLTFSRANADQLIDAFADVLSYC
jgi:4-aminobutyrate aminotransferase-like enzyme